MDPNFAGFRGFQFNFLVTVRSLYEVRRVVPIAIDSTGKHQPQLGDLLLDSFDWQGSPAPLPAELQDSWVAMVEQARDAAERVIEQQLREEVSLLKANSQKAYEAERRKVEQYCAYRQTEGERKVQHDKGILVRLRASDREEDQRVVPIWQRNVENDLEYLNTLRGERERLNRDLLKRLDAGYSYELLNAAWIVVVAS